MEDNDITEDALDSLFEVIANNPLLEIVRFVSDSLDDNGILKMICALKPLHGLKRLDLHHKSIKQNFTKHIAEVITNNSELQTVVLNNVTFNLKELFDGIKHNSNFIILNLEYNNITEEAADNLAAVINANKSLAELNLGNNLLSVTGANILAKAVSVLQNIKVLKLDDNQITEHAADGVAEMIINNKGLAVLSLDNNCLNNEGIGKIARALRELHTLNFLSLQNKNITEESSDNLGSIIASNNLIKILDLGDNKLQDVGVVSLVNAFKNWTH